MITLAKSKENKAKVNALKSLENTLGEIFWCGNHIHDNLEKCLVAINLNSTNSGWYNPVAVKIKGLTGYYMLNQNGSLFCEARVIKKEDSEFMIEYLTNEGWNKFENLYRKFLHEN